MLALHLAQEHNTYIETRNKEANEMTQTEFLALANRTDIFTAMWVAKNRGVDGMLLGGKVMKAYVSAFLATLKK